MAWIRLAKARSGAAISAIFASTALASSSLVAVAFRSLTISLIAARSSSVSPVRFLSALADVWVALAGLIRAPPQMAISLRVRLLRVRLIAALRAVPDPPNVAVGVREGAAVPAPLQLRGGLEDLGA